MDPGESEFVFDVDLSCIKDKNIRIIFSAINQIENERAFFAGFTNPFIEELQDETE